MLAARGTSCKKRKTKACDFQECGVWGQSKHVERQYVMLIYR